MILLLILLSFMAVSARKPVGIPKLIAIRGGAGPLNAKDTARAAAYVFGAHGAYGALAPAKANEALGLPSNPLDNFILTRSSTMTISIVLLIWELVFKGTTLTKAVGISAIPPVIHIVQSLLNDDIINLGFTIGSQYPLLIFWSLIVYNGLTGSKYALGLVKAFGIVNLVLGLYFYFFPTETLKLFGRTQPVSTSNKVQLRDVALIAFIQGVIISSIAFKKIDALKAIGYGWIPIVLHILNGLFVSKEFVELRLNRGVVLFGLVFNVIVAATLAF